jgi:mono/diheme cytochrome c family protein
MKRRLLLSSLILLLFVTLAFAQKQGEQTKRHESGLGNAPESVHRRQNPYDGQSEAIRAGRKLFHRHCAECHADDALGRGKAPALDSNFVGSAPPGDLFWFLTSGNLRTGMPSWSKLPDAQRWQIVAYLKSLRNAQSR